jgi:hypothetical protein
MEKVIAIAVVAFVVGSAIACSDSKEGTGAPACSPVGTFSVQDTKLSGTCPSDESPGTVTVSAAQGSTTDFIVEFQGVSGGCDAQRLGSECKLQGKCDLTIANPADPRDAAGTLQFSWTFDAAGLKGTSTLSLPATAGAAGADAGVTPGCGAEYSSAGQRR